MKKLQLQKKLLQKGEEISHQMEKYNIAEYISILNNPKRYLMVNFLAGLARGFGIAVGFTILGAMVVYFLQRVMLLNLPVIGDFIAEIVKLVQKNM
ncbi:DUF5665 domain-containing protein [Proteinivorax hydrogeniformans]|uniref:DUF5665 domain-containing protein n=1 Tax=Proteinivorax hydrogeniformans TaxID=1826727 RepID=A0AAU8HPJ8_9FIRM